LFLHHLPHLLLACIASVLLSLLSAAQAAPPALPPAEAAKVSKHGGILSIPLADGRIAKYRDNLLITGGTFVNYHYRGYIAAISAHRIDMERMENQTYLLNHRTGQEVAIGRFFSISPNRKLIFSSDCRETDCYYNIVSWPAGKEVFLKKLPLQSGMPASDKDLAPIPVIIDTVRWQSNNEVTFTSYLADASAPSPVRKRVLLKLQGTNWQASPAR